MLKDVIPTLQDYEEVFKGNLKPWVLSGLNTDTIEGRFKLFVRIQQHSKQQDDPRPQFSKWVMEQHKQISTGEEYKEFFAGVSKDVSDISDDMWESYAGGITYPASILWLYRDLYQMIFPDNLVKYTPIGLLVKDVLEKIEGNREVEELIEDTVGSAMLEVLNCYKVAVETGASDPNDINWDRLVWNLYTTDCFGTYHREHYGSNIMGEISNPFGKEGTYCDFILDTVPFLLKVAYGVDPIEISTLPKELSEHRFISEDIIGVFVNDSENGLFESNTYLEFAKEYGEVASLDKIKQMYEEAEEARKASGTYF